MAIAPEDIKGQVTGQPSISDNRSNSSTQSEIEYLRSIDAKLQQLLRHSASVSSANARNAMPDDRYFRQVYESKQYSRTQPKDHRYGDRYDDRYSRYSRYDSQFNSPFSHRYKGVKGGLEDALLDSLITSDFKHRLRNTFNKFADGVGIHIKDIPYSIGKYIGKVSLDAVKHTQLGKNVLDSIMSMRDKALNSIDDAFKKASKFKQPPKVTEYDSESFYTNDPYVNYTYSTTSPKYTKSDAVEDYPYVYEQYRTQDNINVPSQSNVLDVINITAQSVDISTDKLINSSIQQPTEQKFIMPDDVDKTSSIEDAQLSQNVFQNIYEPKSVETNDYSNKLNDHIDKLQSSIELSLSQLNIHQPDAELLDRMHVESNNIESVVRSSLESTSLQIPKIDIDTSALNHKDAVHEINEWKKHDDSNSYPDDAINNLSEHINRYSDILDSGLNTLSNVKLHPSITKLDQGTPNNMSSIADTLNNQLKMIEPSISPKLVSQNVENIDTKLLGAASKGLSAFTSEAGSATGLLGELSTVAGPVIGQFASFIPVVGAVVAGMMILDLALDTLSPAIEGAKKLFNTLKDTGNRYYTSRQKNLELMEKRMAADLESVIKAPFEILKDAAEEVYKAWDSNIRVINGTQGYNKSDLQDLMSVYAQRLRNEGLTKVVSGSDITDSLAKVLESGLSGAVAEEFAYTATKLNAAIPTQDFFSYADVYAELAATAIKNGASESAAIEYANSQLETFASNVLYANRQLSGGFTTGLKNAQDLFEDAVKIAQSSKTGDAAQISGVLTAVAAATGSIAPDLANSMTDIIVKAATGGNSSELVALRSLAGVNASNTEFLKQIATDPQKVFSTLFNNLADMQNMSNDAYMEVAEGLSSVFGISMDAFARIDFKYLADAISNMNVNNSSLDENIKLLASGETTTTAEQLRMQQINEYMIEEGLSYVLDNEVARSIQEHMWDEQLAREIMEAEYAVNLRGSALEFLESIKNTVDNIMRFLNPVGSMINSIVNVVNTSNEANAQLSDIAQILQLGKVGNNTPVSAAQLAQLLSKGVDLNLTPNIVELLGGVSAYDIAADQSKYANMITSPSPYTSYTANSGGDLVSRARQSTQFDTISSPSNLNSSSKYTWANVGKSVAEALFKSVPEPNLFTSTVSNTTAGESATQINTNKNLQRMIDSMADYAKDHSYQDWVNTASKFGIADFNKALDATEYSNSQLESVFQTYSTNAGIQAQSDIRKQESDFRNNMQTYALDMIDKASTRNEQLDTIISLTTEGNNKLNEVFSQIKTFYTAWVDYYVNHTAYKKAYTHSDVTSVQRKEQKGSEDAVYALADALTKNTVDLTDPVIQTNALLSQILKVVGAIMQQNNKVSTSGLSLPDTLAGLSLGLISNT